MKIPKAEVVDVEKLKIDNANPNRMTEKQLERLKTSIEQFGFIVPIITNRDFLVADGEQRLNAAKQLGYKQVSVIRLDVADVDRRLLRQVLNKLRGEHDLIADALEFERIIAENREEDLKLLLDLSDVQLEMYLSQLREPEEIPPPKPIGEVETNIKRYDKFQLGVNQLYCGDCVEVMDAFPKESVDFVMFSPPYWSKRDYGVKEQLGLEPHPLEYITKLVKVCNSIKRILKPQGSMYLVMGDSYAGSGVSLARHKRTVRNLEGKKP